MNPRRARILGELGLVRYRLRTLTSAGAPAATRVADAIAPSAVRPALTVHVPDIEEGVAGTDVAAAVWGQVLAWLRLAADDVEWSRAPDAPALVLPASTEWSTPAGKRALWLALKPFAAARMH